MLAELYQIVTKDKILLEGLFFGPKRKGNAAAVWVSGLTGRFSASPQRTLTLAKILNAKGIAFAVFDHRGYGVVNSLKRKTGKKTKYIFGGTTFERFDHCVYDIDAVIRFLRRSGYKKVFLLGHSTGANKIAYYSWKTKGRGIAGLTLLGPLSDIPIFKKQLGKKYNTAVKWAQTMIKKGKRNTLLPFSYVDRAFWSAERFLSITKEGGKEDTFSYYDPKRKFYWTRNLRVPVLVLIGSKEQYADRPVREIMGAFKKNIPEKFFTGKIVAGADHGFKGKEKELAQIIKDWILKQKNLTKKQNP